MVSREVAFEDGSIALWPDQRSKRDTRSNLGRLGDPVVPLRRRESHSSGYGDDKMLVSEQDRLHPVLGDPPDPPDPWPRQHPRRLHSRRSPSRYLQIAQHRRRRRQR